MAYEFFIADNRFRRSLGPFTPLPPSMRCYSPDPYSYIDAICFSICLVGAVVDLCVPVQECPLAMEAAQALLQMGVKGTEVACLMVNGTSNVPNMEW